MDTDTLDGSRIRTRGAGQAGLAALGRQLARVTDRATSDLAFLQDLRREPRATLEAAGLPVPLRGDILVVEAPGAEPAVRRIGAHRTLVLVLPIDDRPRRVIGEADVRDVVQAVGRVAGGAAGRRPGAGVGA